MSSSSSASSFCFIQCKQSLVSWKILKASLLVRSSYFRDLFQTTSICVLEFEETVVRDYLRFIKVQAPSNLKGMPSWATFEARLKLSFLIQDALYQHHVFNQFFETLEEHKQSHFLPSTFFLFEPPVLSFLTTCSFFGRVELSLLYQALQTTTNTTLFEKDKLFHIFKSHAKFYVELTSLQPGTLMSCFFTQARNSKRSGLFEMVHSMDAATNEYPHCLKVADLAPEEDPSSFFQTFIKDAYVYLSLGQWTPNRVEVDHFLKHVSSPALEGLYLSGRLSDIDLDLRHKTSLVFFSLDQTTNASASGLWRLPSSIKQLVLKGVCVHKVKEVLSQLPHLEKLYWTLTEEKQDTSLFSFPASLRTLSLDLQGVDRPPSFLSPAFAHAIEHSFLRCLDFSSFHVFLPKGCLPPTLQHLGYHLESDTSIQDEEQMQDWIPLTLCASLSNLNTFHFRAQGFSRPVDLSPFVLSPHLVSLSVYNAIVDENLSVFPRLQTFSCVLPDFPQFVELQMLSLFEFPH